MGKKEVKWKSERKARRREPTGGMRRLIRSKTGLSMSGFSKLGGCLSDAIVGQYGTYLTIQGSLDKTGVNLKGSVLSFEASDVMGRLAAT